LRIGDEQAIGGSPPGRRRPRKYPMANSGKDRLATAVADRWSSFRDALAGTKPKYPIQAFLSFADAARRHIDLPRRDRCVSGRRHCPARSASGPRLEKGARSDGGARPVSCREPAGNPAAGFSQAGY
jgi:hypothetical protein